VDFGVKADAKKIVITITRESTFFMGSNNFGLCIPNRLFISSVCGFFLRITKGRFDVMSGHEED
jgi:hypothetical protein